MPEFLELVPPPQALARLMDYIHFVRDRFNLTILLIEHQMRLVMNICERETAAPAVSVR